MNIHSDYRAHRYLDCFPVPKGQINVTVVHPGTTCAFHRHLLQTDYWLVVKGTLEVITVLDEDVQKFILKEGMWYCDLECGHGSVEIEPKYWHGYRCIGNEPAILMYYVTEKYDPKKPDEERITPEKLGVEFSKEIK